MDMDVSNKHIKQYIFIQFQGSQQCVNQRQDGRATVLGNGEKGEKTMIGIKITWEISRMLAETKRELLSMKSFDSPRIKSKMWISSHSPFI